MLLFSVNFAAKSQRRKVSFKRRCKKSQIIEDNTKSEKQNIEFLKKKIETEVVKSTGELKAKAFATSKTYEIEGNALLLQSKMNVESKEIELINDGLNVLIDDNNKEDFIDKV